MADYFEMQNEETSIISYDISVIPNDFNVMTINSLIESGVISMPAFQRNYVWDRKRASRFIESLILGLPVPQIFYIKWIEIDTASLMVSSDFLQCTFCQATVSQKRKENIFAKGF